MNHEPKKRGVGDKKRVRGFNVVADACIWMKAGVINFHTCDNDFDCSSCPFDKGMRNAMGIKPAGETEPIAPRWVEHLQRSYYGAERPCRHALTGRIGAPKICAMNYECYHCSFDQLLDDMDISKALDPPEYDLASGYKMARGYYYHVGHSWSRFEHGGRLRIGGDDFLVKVFGCPQAMELPPLGEKLKQNDVGWAFTRGGRRAAVLSPATGTVLAVNHHVLEHPEIVVEDPYHEGWLVIMEPVMPKRNLRGLYYGWESIRWMESESRRLLALMGPEYKNLAATGAEPVGDVYGSVPEIGWEVLAREFLLTESRK